MQCSPGRFVLRLAVLGLLAWCAGCHASAYRCDPRGVGGVCDNTRGEVCTVDGLCAAPATDCPSRYRYSVSALRDLACVAPNAVSADGGIPGDVPGDAPGDAPGDGPARCVPGSLRMLAPMSGSRVMSPSPVLRWNADARVPRVIVRIATTRAGLDGAGAQVAMVPTTMGSYTPGPALAHAGWFWAVIPDCGDGSTQTPVGIWHFWVLHEESTASGWVGVGPPQVDFNGDGVADIAAGSPANSRVDVWQGNTVSALAGATPVTSLHGTLGDFGIHVAGAGDVNGDGYGDLAVSACPGPEDTHVWGPCTSGVKLYLGGPMGMALHGTPWDITAPTGVMGFGRSLAGVGDINGDGYGDLAVGAGTTDATGSVVLVLGGATGPTGTVTIPAPPDPHATGSTPALGFGQSVAAAGDMDGDGLPDVVIGAPGSNSFALVFGSRTLAGTLAATDVHLSRGIVGAGFGTVIRGVGDLNDDGLADIVLSAPAGNAVLPYIGGTRDFLTAATRDHDRSLVGGMGSNTGIDVAGGDLAGNGTAVLTAGADGTMPGMTGVVALFSAARATSVADPGSSPGRHFGRAVSCPGDVDGDDYEDLVVGSPGDPASGLGGGTGGAGPLTVIFGDPDLGDATATLNLQTRVLGVAAGPSAGDGRTLALGRRTGRPWRLACAMP